MISESTTEANDESMGNNIFRTGVQTRIFVQQTDDKTDEPVAHFIVSDVNSVTELLIEADNSRQIISQINETLVFSANATGEITNWSEVVGSGISNIPDTMRDLEEKLGDKFDDLPF